MKIIVNKHKCPQNHRCPSIAVCPKEAISQKDNFSLPVVDGEKCIVCGKCMRFCPKDAFEKVE
ncbi:MAG: 4Fe-4S binding protein [Firmicutes bacterium]|jgi:ferredoxin|nr:4Fe-4S binding protein [Bacillota bacterium]